MCGTGCSSPVCQGHLGSPEPCRGQYNTPLAGAPAAAHLPSRLCPPPPARTCRSPPPFLRGDFDPEALQEARGKRLSRRTGLKGVGGQGLAPSLPPAAGRAKPQRWVRRPPQPGAPSATFSPAAAAFSGDAPGGSERCRARREEAPGPAPRNRLAPPGPCLPSPPRVLGCGPLRSGAEREGGAARTVPQPAGGAARGAPGRPSCRRDSALGPARRGVPGVRQRWLKRGRQVRRPARLNKETKGSVSPAPAEHHLRSPWLTFSQDRSCVQATPRMQNQRLGWHQRTTSLCTAAHRACVPGRGSPIS